MKELINSGRTLIHTKKIDSYKKLVADEKLLFFKLKKKKRR
jgi:hypothetical protein